VLHKLLDCGIVLGKSKACVWELLLSAAADGEMMALVLYGCSSGALRAAALRSGQMMHSQHFVQRVKLGPNVRFGQMVLVVTLHRCPSRSSSSQNGDSSTTTSKSLSGHNCRLKLCPDMETARSITSGYDENNPGGAAGNFVCKSRTFPVSAKL
jgi:hypothetical protein